MIKTLERVFKVEDFVHVYVHFTTRRVRTTRVNLKSVFGPLTSFPLNKKPSWFLNGYVLSDQQCCLSNPEFSTSSDAAEPVSVCVTAWPSSKRPQKTLHSLFQLQRKHFHLTFKARCGFRFLFQASNVKKRRREFLPMHILVPVAASNQTLVYSQQHLHTYLLHFNFLSII